MDITGTIINADTCHDHAYYIIKTSDGQSYYADEADIRAYAVIAWVDV